MDSTNRGLPREESLLIPEASPAWACGHDLGGVRRGHKITVVAGEPHLNVANLTAPAQDDALEPQPATPHRTVVGDAQVRRGKSLLAAQGGGHCVAGGRVGKSRQVAAKQCPVRVADRLLPRSSVAAGNSLSPTRLIPSFPNSKTPADVRHRFRACPAAMPGHTSYPAESSPAVVAASLN